MDYIYGKLCQKVKEVEYSGGTTDTIQVSVNNDTNTITADYIGEQDSILDKNNTFTGVNSFQNAVYISTPHYRDGSVSIGNTQYGCSMNYNNSAGTNIGRVQITSRGVSINGLVTPTEAGDGANKGYVDEQIAGLSTKYLSLNGGTMNGDIVLPHGVDEMDEEYSHSIILRNDNDVAGDIKLDYNGIKYTDNMYNNFVFDIGKVRIGGTNMESDGTQSGYITVNQDNGFGLPAFGAVNSETTSFSKYLDSGGSSADAYYSDLHSTKDMLITTTGNSVSFKKYSSASQTGPQLSDIRITGVATPTSDNDAVNKKYVDNGLNNKVDSTNEEYKVYGTGSDGTAKLYGISKNSDGFATADGALAQRDVNGNLQVPTTPLYSMHATSKYYVDQNKVAKRTSGNEVYSHTAGTQGGLTYSQNATANHIVQRKTGGQIAVPATPSADTDAASKKYVDDNSGRQKLYQHNIAIRTINHTTQAYVGVIISNSNVPFDDESLWQYLHDHNFKGNVKLLGVTGYDAANKRVGIGIYYNSSAGAHVPWFLYGTIDGQSLSNDSALVVDDTVVEI